MDKFILTMSKEILAAIILSTIIIVLSSCQKEIQIDLNSVTPVVVIEGSISNQPGPYMVKISRTVNYYETNTFPEVRGAFVQISDDSGTREVLKENSPGVYSTLRLRGVPGRIYTLDVIINGTEYKSISAMPYPVNIDSVSIANEMNEFDSEQPRYQINVLFRDPAEKDNYYRFVKIYEEKRYGSISVMSDRFRDGKEISHHLDMDISSQTISGNQLKIEMESIDKGTYDFFRTFHNVVGGDELGFLYTSPANPISNISNGALGYFSAYSATYKSVILP